MFDMEEFVKWFIPYHKGTIVRNQNVAQLFGPDWRAMTCYTQTLGYVDHVEGKKWTCFLRGKLAIVICLFKTFTWM